MTVFDFIGFRAERDSATFAKRVGTDLFDAPTNFPTLSGTETLLSVGAEDFLFRNQQTLSGELVFGVRFRCANPFGQRILSVLTGVTSERISLVATAVGEQYVLSVIDSATTVVFGTTSQKLNKDEWHLIEFKAVPSTDGSGSVEVRVDEFPVIKLDGLTIGQTDDDVDGCYFQVRSNLADPGSYSEFDYVYCADGFLGFRKVEELYPVGNGTYSGWSPVGADINAAAVDDSALGTVDDDSSYVQSVSNQADTYKLNETPVEGRVSAAILETYMKDPDASLEEHGLLRYRNQILETLATVSVDSSEYKRLTHMLQNPDFDKRSLPEEEFGQGDSEASVAGAHNTIIFFIDDPTLDCYSLYADINPFTGDDPVANKIFIDAPVLDAAAAEGVTFKNGYANSTSTPSRASLLTGLYCHQHNVGTVVGPTGSNPDQNFYEFGDFGRHTTLADILKANGVSTAIIGKYHMAMDVGEDSDPPSGFSGSGWAHITAQTGFDLYNVAFRNLNQTPYPDNAPIAVGSYYMWTKRHYGEGIIDYTYEATSGAPPAENYATTVQIDDALEFAKNLPEPFVLYVALSATHGPFNQAPEALVNTPEYKLAWPGGLWENAHGMHEALDTEIGRFLDSMDAGRKERSTFMFVGDNGTDVAILNDLANDFDLGSTYDFLLSEDGLRQRFKRALYDRGGRTPVVIWGASVENGGRDTQALFHVVDVFSTVLELQGIIPPTTGLDNKPIHGVSVLPILRDLVDASSHARKDLLIERFIPNGYLPTVFYTEWDNSTSYSIGDKVWYDYREEYECIQAHSNQEPPNSSYWVKLGEKFRGHAYYYYLEDGAYTTGLYSLVIIYGQSHELYRLKDVNWTDVDPYQLTPLDLGTYSAEYDFILNAYQELVSGNTDPNPKGGISVITPDGGVGIVIRRPDGDFDVISENGTEEIISAPDPNSLEITDPDGNTGEVEID